MEHSPAKKALCGGTGEGSTPRQHCSHSTESQPEPGCIQGSAVQPAGRGRGSAPLLCAGTPHLEHCIPMGSAQHRTDTDLVECVQRRDTKRGPQMEKEGFTLDIRSKGFALRVVRHCTGCS